MKKTLDELLEEALVPDDEQPYEIPENWVWVKLKGIASVKGGKRLPKGHQLIDEKTNYPYIRVTDFNESTINVENIKYLQEETASKISRYTISTKDLYISIAGTIGKTGIIPKELDGANLTENAAKIVLDNGVTNKFLHYLFRNSVIQEQIFISTVSSSQPKLALFRIEELYIPLPSKSEQSKIADKIEILFAKIDEAQQLIQETKEAFTLRRSAILDMAFRGGNIRGKEDLPKGWQYKKFKDIATVKSNLVNPLEFLSYPHIAPDNIEKHTGRLLSYRTIQEDGVKSNKHYFEKGSILYSKIRPYLSKVVIVDFDGLCSADMYPIETELNVEYLYWYMLSPQFLEQATTAGSRSVLPKINQKELGEILVPVCSIEEQEKTLNNLNNLLQEESSILNFIEKSEKDLDKLKQSILSKAFKGELGTNDPTDEPAIELLKSILQEKL